MTDTQFPITRDYTERLRLRNQDVAASFSGEYDELPAATKLALYEYAKSRLVPGDYLRAVVSNDLRLACHHADSQNLRTMHLAVRWMYNNAPSTCWGSHEAFAAWTS